MKSDIFSKKEKKNSKPWCFTDFWLNFDCFCYIINSCAAALLIIGTKSGSWVKVG